MKSFLDSLSAEDRKTMQRYKSAILEIDNKVVEKVSSIMSVTDALVYEQEGVFKYGLTRTKHHYSFHSMVMYANPDVAEFIKSNAKGAKIQKGCINFTSFDDFPIELFKRIMALSAKKDFSPVIDHYKKKK